MSPLDAPVPASLDEEVRTVASLALPGFSAAHVEIYSGSRRRSTAYLVADASRSTSLAVKRLPSAAARLEERIYRRILPPLGVVALTCHGTWPSAQAGHSWLVTDHVAGEAFDHSRREHASSLARWAARLHTGSAAVPLAMDLPSRGLDHSHNLLGEAHEVMVAGIDNAAVTAEERSSLATLRDLIEQILDDWTRMASLFHRLPMSLVHGDLTRGNVRMVRRGNESVPYVLDWETAGKGSPLLDLPILDAAAYGEAIKPTWHELDLPTLYRLRTLGTVVWTAYVIAGERASLISAWPHRAAAKVKPYIAWIGTDEDRANLLGRGY
jgi:hypothetical protein